jgi:hypothetical protein
MGDYNKDYPYGGFVADAVCWSCGADIRVNVPATPERMNFLETRVKCPSCREISYVYRFKTGEWKVTDKF